MTHPCNFSGPEKLNENSVKIVHTEMMDGSFTVTPEPTNFWKNRALNDLRKLTSLNLEKTVKVPSCHALNTCYSLSISEYHNFGQADLKKKTDI